jgi:opacity protein-like surface antigen
MRKVTLALSAVVGLCVLAQTAAAQTKPWQFGPQVSFATNNYGPGIGARAVFSGLGTAVKVPGLGAYGSFDYFLPSSSFYGSSPTFWEINVNGTWDIPDMTGGFKPYVGAGINYAHLSQTIPIIGSVSGSETGLNLLGGARFNPTPKLHLFGEVRLELRSGSAAVFTVGLLF